jgi:hypothetical protein
MATAGAQAERPIRWTLERASEQAGSVGKDSVPFRLDAQIDKSRYMYAPSQPAAGPYAMEVRVETGSPLAVLVRYQACTRRYCLPPRTDTLCWAADGVLGAPTAPTLETAPTPASSHSSWPSRG